jgi:hypothetical protein
MTYGMGMVAELGAPTCTAGVELNQKGTHDFIVVVFLV